jgi:FixJ family two-component response regulator
VSGVVLAGDRIIANSDPTVFAVAEKQAVVDLICESAQKSGYRFEFYRFGSAFLENYDPDKTGCLIVEHHLPDMRGLDFLHRLREAEAMIATIILLGRQDVHLAVESIKAGAVDVLSVPIRPEDLRAKIQEAIRLDMAFRRDRGRLLEVRARFDRLAPREREVLELVVKGRTSKEISQHLNISRRTVEAHRASIMAKLNARSCVDLVRMSVAYIAYQGNGPTAGLFSGYGADFRHRR